MWEITLIGKPYDIVHFLELKNVLKSSFGKSVIVVITFEKDLICSIAVIEKKYIQIVKNFVYEIILKLVKLEFYEQNLTIFSEDKSLNSFLLTNIVLVDLVDEVRYAKSISKLTKVVNIRSFVYFKLNKFIQIWKRDLQYYNKNFIKYDRQNLYLDFLKFLANHSKRKTDIMYLEEGNKEMILLDKKRKKIKTIEKDDEIGIVVNLVMFAPKKIIINCIDSLSQKVSSLISYIFEDKVSVLL